MTMRTEGPRLRILAVDDQPSVRELLKAVLEADGHDIETAADGAEAVRALGSGFHDLVIMDIRMPGMDGITALERVKELSPRTGVVMMTAYASVETAVKAMKLGAFDYVTKPIDIDEVRAVLARFIESIDPTEVEGLPVESRDVVGASEALRAVLELAHRVAASDATVLVLGESGTGKEVVAREIHREPAPAPAVHRGELRGDPRDAPRERAVRAREGLVHRRRRQKKGRFELAEGGTIFLDEIGDMSPALQAKLLRVLQEQRLQRVGGSADVIVDVRVIAATNRDLERDVAEGRFREDLFFRLNVVTITVPPLRERPEDIPPLVEHFLKLFAPEGTKPKKVSHAPCGS